MRIIDWSSDVCSSDLDEAIEADGCAVLDRLHQLRRRLRTPALALGDPRFMRDEAEDIAGGGDQAIVEEGLDVLTAEPLDVEGLARDERAQALVALRLAAAGSAERRVGKACVSTCSSGWAP